MVIFMFVLTAFIFIAAAGICLLISFRFDEKSMAIRNHTKDIIKHEQILKSLLRDFEQDEWKDSEDEELGQIYKHAMYIKRILVDKK